MSNPARPAPSPMQLALQSLAIGLAATAAVVLAAVALRGPRATAPMWAGVLHAPNLALIAAAPPAIKIHLASALAAVVLATLQMTLPKGRPLHRLLGWTLSALLMVTATASVFIVNPFQGRFTPFLVFSVWTLIGVPLGVQAARAHNVRRHAWVMSGIYYGGLILAGVLTLLPGRLLWRVFFG